MNRSPDARDEPPGADLDKPADGHGMRWHQLVGTIPMNARKGAGSAMRPAFAPRSVIAATLAGSGYIHTQLYLAGYRFIHIVGVLYLLQAIAAFAVAALMLFTAPALLRVAAAGVALGALAGFTASRTIGVFGFTERGLQPAPQAMLNLLLEVGTLLLLAAWQQPRGSVALVAPNIP
ncbi:hypothetical protein [Kitasatospora aureofaciens]|uniref:hypothetical protein n=1 Tax=Kitasatospora aureofaciens TaxID=1894 RepID=UPI0036F46B40